MDRDTWLMQPPGPGHALTQGLRPTGAVCQRLQTGQSAGDVRHARRTRRPAARGAKVGREWASSAPHKPEAQSYQALKRPMDVGEPNALQCTQNMPT